MNNNNEEKFDIVIGQDELGNDVHFDITKIRHLLIAGMPESGKTNFLHKIISALISSYSPTYLKLILSNPNKLELGVYNKVPHLLAPVTIENKKILLTLRWLNKEISRRLDIMRLANAQNIESYNQKKSIEEILPRIIYIVDGLQSVINEYPKESESVISKITEIGHITGINLIFTVSKIDKKIISNSLKTDIPSKLIFKTSTNNESKIVLGSTGAERLQTQTEALFQSYMMKYPICIKIPHTPKKEIDESVKKSILNLGQKKYQEDYKSLGIEENDLEDEDDDLYPIVCETVISLNKASTSLIQRKFGIGYSRAAKLLDILEKRGIIGPAKGAKPREVYNTQN